MSVDNSKITAEEFKAITEILGIYLLEETNEYNSNNSQFAQKGDIISITKTTDNYLEYLKILENHLILGVQGLKKTINRLESNSKKFKIRYLNKMFDIVDEPEKDSKDD